MLTTTRLTTGIIKSDPNPTTAEQFIRKRLLWHSTIHGTYHCSVQPGEKSPCQPQRFLGGKCSSKPETLRHSFTERVRPDMHETYQRATCDDGCPIKMYGASLRRSHQSHCIPQQSPTTLLRSQGRGRPANPHPKGPILLHLAFEQRFGSRALHSPVSNDGRHAR
jgi:hypothetical protein